MEIARLIREPNDRGRVRNVYEPGIVGGIEGDAERMVEPGSETLYLCRFAIRPHTPKNKNDACAGVGNKQIAVWGRADQPRLAECALARRLRAVLLRVLLIGRRARTIVSPCVQRHLEPWGRDRPGILRAQNDMRLVANRLRGIGLGKIGDRELTRNSRFFLTPIGECRLSCNGILSSLCRKGDRAGDDNRNDNQNYECHFHRNSKMPDPNDWSSAANGVGNREPGFIRPEWKAQVAPRVLEASARTKYANSRTASHDGEKKKSAGELNWGDADREKVSLTVRRLATRSVFFYAAMVRGADETMSGPRR
jgi:hypothetical protein